MHQILKCKGFPARLLQFFLILLFIYSKTEAAEPVKIINLYKALKNNNANTDFDIFSNLDYIKIETDKSCIIGGFPRFFVDDDYIIAYSFRSILLFSKNTGEFYREIGSYDKSPNGYSHTIATLAFNEKDKIIYAGDWDESFCGYNYCNQKIIKINIPYKYISSFGYINDTVYAGFIWGNIGGKKMRLNVFNKSGESTHIFPNNLPYTTSNPFHFNMWEGIFFRFDGTLNYKEIYNDTLFQIKEDTLIPRYFFNLGKYAPPPGQRDELEKIITRNELGMVTMKLDNYIVTKTICESTRYLFFEFDYKNKDYWGVYDKKKEETHIQRNEDNIKINGIEMPFRLTRAFINQENQELITFIDAYQLEHWINNNPEKVKALPAEIHQELIKVNSTDNPVVIIAKLKK